MKNLFKSLMLVAVAAMAFTACSQDNNEVNKLERKTVYNFQANIADDDTRSGFMEKEDGATAYKSEWFGDETIKVFVTDYNGYNAEVATPIDAEGKFELELTDAPEFFFVTVVSPAESWVSENTANIPAEQTPLANSVDPKAHLLQAQAVPVSNGSAAISMNHMTAYGKMTVNGVDFEIDHVVIDLVGSYYNSARELSYTINADNVENNTFWFATEPIDVAEFTVTAYDAEGKAVAKTVDVAAAGKTLSFQYGRVGTFSVSGLEVQAEKYDSTYAYVYEDYGETDKMIMFVAEDGRGLRIDFYDVYDDNCIVPGTYTFSNTVGMYPGWCYYHADADANYTSKLNGGQAVVSVEDGQYKIVFTNMALDNTVYVEQFTFKGLIDGIDFPDPRIKLAAPNVTAEISGKTISLSWDDVVGADSYMIEIYSDVETVSPVSTTETHFEFTVKNYDSYYSFKVTAVVAEDDTEYRNSGYYSYVEYTDPREQLSAPANLTAVADGLSVTLSWDAVDYATGYEVEYYDNGSVVENTTETSITLEMSDYDTVYYFYVYAVADENSDSYRTSYEAYTSATTGKDSNAPFAEYMASNLYWNSSAEAFEFVVDHYEIFRVKMNNADCPDHTTILEGEYTGIGSSTVPAKSFSVYQKVVGGYSEGWSSTKSTSTMSVSYVDGEYVIIVNYISAWGGSGEVGYKGIPEGWDVPGTGDSGDSGDSGDDNTGGEGGDDNTDDGDDDNTGDSNMPGSESNPYVFKSVSKGQWDIQFTGADNGDRIVMDCNTINVDLWISDHGADTWIAMTKLLYSTGASIYGHNGYDYINEAFWSGSFVKVVKSGSTYTFTFNMSIDGGTTQTYYTYTGTL